MSTLRRVRVQLCFGIGSLCRVLHPTVFYNLDVWLFLLPIQNVSAAVCVRKLPRRPLKQVNGTGCLGRSRD